MFVQTAAIKDDQFASSYDAVLGKERTPEMEIADAEVRLVLSWGKEWEWGGDGGGEG